MNEAAELAGSIELGAETKTHAARTVSLAESPALRRLLAVLRLQAGDANFVFGDGAALPRSRLPVDAPNRHHPRP